MSTWPASHHRRHGDPHGGQKAKELAAHNRDSRQQESFPTFIALGQNWMSVVEVVEQLRQLKHMFGKVSRFGRSDA